MNRVKGLLRLAVGVVAFASPLAPSPFTLAPQAQDVVRLLQEQRRQAVLDAAAEAVPEAQPRGLHLYPQTDWALLRLDTREQRRRFVADSTEAARLDSLARATAEADTLFEWRKVAPGSQAGFISDYREVFWRALSGFGFSPIDTLGTLELRARMTQRFGTPTRNAAAARQEQYAGSEFIQFEYWLVANDSIHVLVLDTHGPFGRGLLIAADEHHRDLFVRLKRDLARLRLTAPPNVPFVDYYQEPEEKQWYKTGFDGTAFFTEAIRQPRWSRNFAGEKWLIHR